MPAFEREDGRQGVNSFDAGFYCLADSLSDSVLTSSCNKGHGQILLSHVCTSTDPGDNEHQRNNVIHIHLLAYLSCICHSLQTPATQNLLILPSCWTHSTEKHQRESMEIACLVSGWKAWVVKWLHQCSQWIGPSFYLSLSQLCAQNFLRKGKQTDRKQHSLYIFGRLLTTK